MASRARCRGQLWNRHRTRHPDYGFFIQPLRAELGWSLQALSLVPIMHVFLALCSPASGWLIDRWGARRALLSGLLVVGFCLVGFAAVHPTPLLLYGLAIAIVCIAVLLVGGGQGAEGDFVAFFVFRNFGMRSFSTLVDIINFFVRFGIATGGYFFAVLFDKTSSYLLSTQFAAGCFVTDGALIYLTRFAPESRKLWASAS